MGQSGRETRWVCQTGCDSLGDQTRWDSQRPEVTVGDQTGWDSQGVRPGGTVRERDQVGQFGRSDQVEQSGREKRWDSHKRQGLRVSESGKRDQVGHRTRTILTGFHDDMGDIFVELAVDFALIHFGQLAKHTLHSERSSPG